MTLKTKETLVENENSSFCYPMAWKSLRGLVFCNLKFETAECWILNLLNTYQLKIELLVWDISSLMQIFYN